MTTFNKLLIQFSPLNSRVRLKSPCFFFLSPRTSSSYWLSHSQFYSTSSSSSFMEVVKAIAKQGSAASNSVAVRADRKSYSYRQLISSAEKISSLLRTSDSQSISEGRQLEHSLVSVDGHKDGGSLDGTRVGIIAKPSAEFVASVLGTWLSGGVAVPLALSYPEAELLHVMNDSDVSIVLSTEDHQELMETVASKSAAQFSLIPSIPSMTSETNPNGHSESEYPNENTSLKEFEIPTKIEGDNAALVIYTSGTTGKPKGVVHTHRSVLAQVQMLTEAWEYSSLDHILHCLPLHHVHGLFNALLAPMYAGATVEFMAKFSVSGIWQRWRESYPKDGIKADDAVTVFTGVPTMYTRLIQGFEAMDSDVQVVSASAASKLRLMMSGSSALPYPVMLQWETITGHRLLERYGMTEFVMAISNPLRGMRKGGTVGKPFPRVEVKILVEDGSGNDTTGAGELCVRSPSLFREYWKLPEVTKQSFTDDGFFKTGDAVTVDEDGYYIILGRTSADIMKVGGYKLSALEIEAALLTHPAVSECCVLGLPDKTYGEVVCAIIVPPEENKRKQELELKPALTLEEICSWAKDKLAPYKLPTQLHLWESLPRNAMGKVNKKELKKVLVAEG
ncbi:probable CoA ligase CCL8 isoform X2 [Beta vulgaris subsp. vulgaris]|uniref:probable CoA ligase CCL8 isoform X2 n=1 Tax=Beta vulgaris subsp. vulgaris TaxID=3555 RepID=UPI00053F2E8E|nr:probable CoA ligase CCL8 isoform X2 [Beta vulgaris subsp. vulgaris]